MLKLAKGGVKMKILVSVLIVLVVYFPIMYFFNGDATPFLLISVLIAIVIGQLWSLHQKIK